MSQHDPGTTADVAPVHGSTTFRSLQSRNFRLFFGGQMISQVGNWLTLLAQSLLVYELTDSGVALGTLVACQFLPVLLIGAWAGLVADRSDKRRLLVIIQVFAMLQSFMLAGLAILDRPPVVAIYAIAALGGVATAFDMPTRRSFVVEMVPESDVQNAVSLNTAMMTGARVVGPALAGLLVSTAGYSWCFAVDGISYLAVLWSYRAMNPGELRRPPLQPRSKGQVREGIRYARSVPDMWVPLVMTAVAGTLAFNFNVVLQLFVRRTFDGSDAEFTLMLSVLSAGSVVAALLAARRTTVTVRHVVATAGIFGVSMLLMAGSPNLGTAFGLGALMGFGGVLFMTTSTAIVQLRAAPEMRGRVIALQSIVFIGSTPIGGPIVGAICEYFGARAGLVVGGVACLAAAAWGRAAQHRRGAEELIEAETMPGSVRTA